jgi:type I restriction enzyme S subunit
MREGWTETILGNVAEVLDRMRKPVSAAEREKRPGKVPYYGATGQAGWIDKPIFDEELVLLGEDAIDFLNPDVHKAYLISGPSWVNNHAHVLKPKTGKVLPFFLMESLNAVDYSQFVAFGTRSKLTQGSMMGISVNLPPIDEQKRIVDVVASVDAYINALQHQVDTARTARNAVLHELLSAGGDDWTEKTLDAIALNLNSRRIPITKSDRKAGRFPYYGASGIVDYVDNFIFDERTLLISEDGANLTARSTPIAFSAAGKYWVNNHAHVLKFDDIPTQNYVEFYLTAIRIDEWVTGAAQPKLNQKSLNEIPIPLPPIAEQERIVEIVSSMDDVIQAAERAVVEAKNLRSGLLSDLLSGEHEIPVSYDELLGAA